MAGSHRDSLRVLPRFWPPGFPFPAVNPGGIPPGYPPGPAEILAAGISVPRRESRRDLGGITTGIPPKFWRPGFRFAPTALAGSPAEILAAEFSLPAVNPGGITIGIPPRFWPPGFRFAPRIPAGTWRELLPRFWPPGFCFLPNIPSGSWWAHSPRFWSPRFPFLAENLAKIPPRFVRSARLTCMEFDR